MFIKIGKEQCVEKQCEWIQGFFEDERVLNQLNDDYDLIICSALLHEVEQPRVLLKAISKKCNENTLVHINVPNANSMHRLLGISMGIIQDSHDKSENDLKMQHNNVFDKHILKTLVGENGLQVIEEGGFFVKPFSHGQMKEMLDNGIIGEKVLDGLNELARYMPEYASEIYVNCKLK